jgi:hypothetical protein
MTRSAKEGGEAELCACMKAYLDGEIEAFDAFGAAILIAT